jgi:uncharacterized protein YegP (UPF0339 family)
VLHKLDVYRRLDGMWTWRLHAANGRIVATNGETGYESKADAANTARELLAGDLELICESAAPVLLLTR